MHLVVATELVVARKPREPRPELFTFVQAHRPTTAPTYVRQRKPIPTLRASGRPARAGVLAENGWPARVQVVPSAALHERGNEAPQRREIDFPVGSIENAVENVAQASPLRTRGVHVALAAQNLYVVRTHVFVPGIPGVPFVIETWIPLRHLVGAIISEDLFHLTLQLNTAIMLVLDLWQLDS